MDDESELYRWVRSREAEGEMDSQGSFTLVQQKAWEKLGASQLPFPDAWVLKIIQAGVRAGVEAIEVVQSRTDTQFRFRGELDWSWPLVERACLDLQYRPTPELEHLAVGIRALAKSSQRPFSLNFGSSPTIIWNGVEFESAPSSRTLTWPFTLTVSHFEIGESESVFSPGNLDAVRVSTSLFEALRDYCFVCPVTLVVDGYPLAKLRKRELSSMKIRRTVAVLAADGHEQEPPFRLTRDCEGPGSWVEVKPGRNLQGTNLPRGAAVILSVNLRRVNRATIHEQVPGRGGSEFMWIQDGVVAQREELGLSSAFAVHLGVSGEGLETDLTSLHPRKTPEREARRRGALEGLSGELSSLVGELRVTGSPLSAAPISSGALFFGFIIPPLGIYLIADFAWKLAEQEQKRQALVCRLEEQFESLVHQLAELAGS